MHIHNLRYYLVLLILVLRGSSLVGQSSSIVIDEVFDDWNSNMSAYTDGLDNNGRLDFIDMQLSNDDRYLYIKLTLDRELCLANTLIDHDIWLSIDTDNDPSTGFPEQFGYGTDLAIRMKDHYAWFNIPNPDRQVSLGDIGLQIAPTFTSSTFEIALPRDIKPDGINALFPGDTIRLVFSDDRANDRMPNEGKVFSYAFNNEPVRQNMPVDIRKSSSQNIRVVSHNILFNRGFSEEAIDAMQRIVTALKGDVYCFQECEEPAVNVRNYFNAWLPLANGNSWHVRKIDTRVTVSRWPVNDTWILNRINAHSITVPDSMGNSSFLILNGHLSCCSNNASRQEQVDEFASFILDAKAPGGNIEIEELSPIVFVGDMNLVGFAQQYETIITGDIQNTFSFGEGAFLDWDNTELADARPLHVDSNLVYTWRDLQGDGFPPGRLDFQFYSDAVLSKEKAFVLDTEKMSNEWLIALNLEQDDTRDVSDHLPVVVDYRYNVDLISSSSSENSKEPSIKIYPNPASDRIFIESELELSRIIIRDLLGNKLLDRTGEGKEIRLPSIPRGIYVVQLKLANGQERHFKIAAGGQ